MKCVQGASALQNVLSKHAGAGLKVFVVWERVLKTDWAPPSSTVLGRIPDTRAVQFWDLGRVVSKNLGETSFENKVWDWVAVYPTGTKWDSTLPKPAYSGRPVEDVADALDQALASIR